METIRQSHETMRWCVPPGWPSNQGPPAANPGRSVFPPDAVACIDRPSRSAMTSGRARTKGWRFRFDRRSAPVIEPLMGWTGGDDTLQQVELTFPTLDAAVRHAERQGLAYRLRGEERQSRAPRRRRRRSAGRDFSDATLDRLGLNALQESYGQALEGARDRRDPAGPENWTAPIDVVRDGSLSLEAKRSILIDWAYAEYLLDQATNEGMPENGRPSRLGEVEQALLELEREVAGAKAAVAMRRTA